MPPMVLRLYSTYIDVFDGVDIKHDNDKDDEARKGGDDK